MRFVLILIIVLFAFACDSSEKDANSGAKSFTFKSEKAPYSLTLTEPWTRSKSDELNAHADIAANYQQLLFFIVIPQLLPDIPGVDPPDSLALKRASISVLEEQIADFVVDKQGPIRLADTTGQSVIASGTSDGARVKYVTTYVSRGLWGYQIVGWGPIAHESLLVAEMDRILTSWTFTDAKPSPSSDITTPKTE